MTRKDAKAILKKYGFRWFWDNKITFSHDKCNMTCFCGRDVRRNIGQYGYVEKLNIRDTRTINASQKKIAVRLTLFSDFIFIFPICLWFQFKKNRWIISEKDMLYKIKVGLLCLTHDDQDISTNSTLKVNDTHLSFGVYKRVPSDLWLVKKYLNEKEYYEYIDSNQFISDFTSQHLISPSNPLATILGFQHGNVCKIPFYKHKDYNLSRLSFDEFWNEFDALQMWDNVNHLAEGHLLRDKTSGQIIPYDLIKDDKRQMENTERVVAFRAMTQNPNLTRCPLCETMDKIVRAKYCIPLKYKIKRFVSLIKGGENG